MSDSETSTRQRGRNRAPALVLAAVVAFVALAAAGQSGRTGPAFDPEAWTDALLKRDLPALNRLADVVPDPDLAGADGTTALMVAAQAGDEELVSDLLKAGAGPNVTNGNGGTPLMHAAMGGNAAITSMLLDAGADPDATAKLGWSALLLAAAKGHAEAERVLLEAGASVNQTDTYGWTPLMRAVSGGHAAAVDVLLEAPDVDINAREESGATALHVAAQYGYGQLATRLVKAGIDTGAVNQAGFTAAQFASRAKHEALASYLAGVSRQETGLGGS